MNCLSTPKSELGIKKEKKSFMSSCVGLDAKRYPTLGLLVKG